MGMLFHKIRSVRSSLGDLNVAVLGASWPVILASVTITALLVGVRQLGMLEALELGAFDRLIQLRPDAGPDPRLLVVIVTEEDIRVRKEDPLSDRTLAQLLRALEQQQPRAIGLDIYRDIPLEPGHADLAAQLRQSDRVVTVCKSPNAADDPGIPPPPGMPEEQVGFSDIVVDPGGIVRRDLLAVTPLKNSHCATPYSLSLQLARLYLSKQGIKLLDQGHLQFGSTVFKPLKSDAGGYQGMDAGGYQVLLNYRSRDRIANQATLTEVVEGRINPDWIKDRIVLIGYAAASKKDAFYTPYSSGQRQNQQMPGVVVHAQMVSQILSAVLDRRPLFWFWPQWGEVLWIWGWALLGGSLAWGIRHPLRFGLAEGAALGALFSICFGCFLQAGWLPLVPPLLALVGTGGSVIAYKRLSDIFYDSLTGLPNRTLLTKRLRNSIKHAKRQCINRAGTAGPLWKRRVDPGANLFAVLFLDLDRFKIVNESFGHKAGDELLIRVVQRLKACLRPVDTIARLGADEFAILLEPIKDISEAGRIADRIHKKLTLPFSLSGHEVYIGASIGIATSAGASGDAELNDQPEDFLRDAHIAMYRARAQGPAHHQLFDIGMRGQAITRLQLETDLRRAIERQEFQVYYQPIVALRTGRISGFEALVRWQHPQRGFVSPAEFIPVAEETNLIIPIGQWVLVQSCQQLRAWQQQFPTHSAMMISVNLSGKQFAQPDLLLQIKQILQEAELEAHCLKLEITESVVMNNVESAIAVLLQIKALNVRLSIDDFGTGYSSLSYLYRFPVDTLKIDRSFVSRMDHDPESVKIGQTIVALAHNLNMDVVAEGVETATQFAQLKTLGCEYGQGYFFSKPLDAQAAEALIKTQPQW